MRDVAYAEKGSALKKLNREYVLRGGDEGAKRLKLLSAAYWPSTQAFLTQLGLRRKNSLLDVGCGAGDLVFRIANMLKGGSQITGIDKDPRVIEIAQRESRAGKVGAKFKVVNIEGQPLASPDTYDFVYSRSVLTHLQEPLEAIKKMVAAAKPGGIICVEDIEFLGSFSHPKCLAYDQFIELYQAVVRDRGADPNIGPKLFGMFHDAGIEDICIQVTQPTFENGDGKLIPQVTMEHIREPLLASKLARSSEIDRIIRDLDQFRQKKGTLLSFPRIFQVWGSKPVKKKGKVRATSVQTASSPTGMSKLKAADLQEGEGVNVKRLFPTPEHEGSLDPFVLIDEFTCEHPAGVPNHHHRGFEAITYIFEGALRHEDDLGNHSVVKKQGVQRVTFGKGLTHSEFPALKGHHHGIQIWVNLRSRIKNVAPSYQVVEASELPIEKMDGHQIKVVIGSKSPVQVHTAIDLLDVSLNEKADYQKGLRAEQSGIVYVISGKIEMGGISAGPGEGILLEKIRDVRIHAVTESRFLFLAGARHHEPFRIHGSDVR